MSVFLPPQPVYFTLPSVHKVNASTWSCYSQKHGPNPPSQSQLACVPENSSNMIKEPAQPDTVITLVKWQRNLCSNMDFSLHIFFVCLILAMLWVQEAEKCASWSAGSSQIHSSQLGWGAKVTSATPALEKQSSGLASTDVFIVLLR